MCDYDIYINKLGIGSKTIDFERKNIFLFFQKRFQIGLLNKIIGKNINLFTIILDIKRHLF